MKRLSQKARPAKRNRPKKVECHFRKRRAMKKTKPILADLKNGNKSIRRLTLATYLYIKAFGLFFQGWLFVAAEVGCWFSTSMTNAKSWGIRQFGFRDLFRFSLRLFHPAKKPVCSNRTNKSVNQDFIGNNAEIKLEKKCDLVVFS